MCGPIEIQKQIKRKDRSIDLCVFESQGITVQIFIGEDSKG